MCALKPPALMLRARGLQSVTYARRWTTSLTGPGKDSAASTSFSGFAHTMLGQRGETIATRKPSLGRRFTPLASDRVVSAQDGAESEPSGEDEPDDEEADTPGPGARMRIPASLLA